MDFIKVFNEGIPLMLTGLRMTIGISLISISIGVLIGLLSCMMGMAKNPIPRAISAVYVWIIRGTPMIVQAFFVFYAIPQVVKLITHSPFTLTPFVAGIITLSLNSGAYLSELFRGGIQAVPVGQTEAARSLGLSKTRTLIKVILPQAFRIALPSLVNQFIITVKDTSILSVIGLAELVNRAKQYVGSTYRFFETYIFVAVLYLIIISLLMLLSRHVERRLRHEKRHRDR